MKVFGDIGSKFVWFIIIVLAVGFGYVFVLKNFLNPPPAAVLPVSPSSSPAQALSPAQSPDPVAANPLPVPGEPSPILVPDSENSSVNSVSSTSTTDTESPMPALALPDEVALKVPEKLEKGALLKVYINNDDNESPDPIEYSPSKVLKTPGLALVNTSNRSEFQEVSGYFLVEKPGNYNLTISYPQNYYWARLSNFRTKIDGISLPTSKGGRVALEPGWHHVSLFLYAVNVEANSIRPLFGLEGETLKPLIVWRETK